MPTTATARDFASFLQEYEQVPWPEVIVAGRKYRNEFLGHVHYMLTENYHFLTEFEKVTDRAIPAGDRNKLAEEVADIILAEPEVVK